MQNIIQLYKKGFMAGYNDTKDLIIKALMGRPVGTEIQPENHQAYALNMLDYIRSVELVSTNTLIGLAEENTVPIQPNDSRVCYIAGVGQDRTVVFNNFIDNTGNPISITTGEMEGVFVILLWNMEHWVAYTFPTNIISSAELANFYYSYNIRKTYESVTAMNADSTNPVGTDGRLIKIGDLVTVVNTTTPSENGFYSRTVNGWQFQSGFNFQVEQARSQNVNLAPSSKLLDDELNKKTLINLDSEYPLSNEYYTLFGVNETYRLTITSKALSSGNVTITLNGVSTNIYLYVSTDTTPELVASRIASAAIQGWTLRNSGNVVTITSTIYGKKTGAYSYNSGGTGAAGSIFKTIVGRASAAQTIPVSIRKNNLVLQFLTGYRQNELITLQGTATRDAVLSLYLNNVKYDVQIVAGENASNIADKIASLSATDWTVIEHVSGTNTVRIEKNTEGEVASTYIKIEPSVNRKVNLLAITDLTTVSGKIRIILDGVPFEPTINAGSKQEVATQIANFQYTGWTTVRNQCTIQFIKNTGVSSQIMSVQDIDNVGLKYVLKNNIKDVYTDISATLSVSRVGSSIFLEQRKYTGNSFTDTEFFKDTNWSKVQELKENNYGNSLFIENVDAWGTSNSSVVSCYRRYIPDEVKQIKIKVRYGNYTCFYFLDKYKNAIYQPVLYGNNNVMERLIDVPVNAKYYICATNTADKSISSITEYTVPYETNSKLNNVESYFLMNNKKNVISFDKIVDGYSVSKGCQLIAGKRYRITVNTTDDTVKNNVWILRTGNVAFPVYWSDSKESILSTSTDIFTGDSLTKIFVPGFNTSYLYIFGYSNINSTKDLSISIEEYPIVKNISLVDTFQALKFSPRGLLFSASSLGVNSIGGVDVLRTKHSGALAKYYMYFSKDHATGGGAGISLAYCNSDDLNSWTVYGEVLNWVNQHPYGNTDTNAEIEFPCVIWDEENGRYLMYWHSAYGSIVFANSEYKYAQVSFISESVDGINWTFLKPFSNVPLRHIAGDGHNGYISVYRMNGMYYANGLFGGAETSYMANALSYDGVNWTYDKFQDNGIYANVRTKALSGQTDALRYPSVYSGYRTYNNCLLTVNGKFYRLISGGREAYGTTSKSVDIYIQEVSADFKTPIGRASLFYTLGSITGESKDLRSSCIMVNDENRIFYFYQCGFNFLLAEIIKI